MNYYINEDTAWLRGGISFAVWVIVVLACAKFLVYAFCGQVQVSGNSMQPLLDGQDVVLIDRIAYDVGEPGRFEVVVFEREDGKKNVKRVIGLPGETVQIKGGFLFINDELLDAPNALEEVSLAGRADHAVVLGEDEYFLLGDNRDSSEDSRFSNVGNVRRSQLIGRVWLRIFPLIKIRLIRGDGLDANLERSSGILTGT